MTLHHLDNRGTSCALGLARVRQRMEQIALGDMLEVTSRDRFAPFEIPAWAERAGHELIGRRQVGRWWFAAHVITLRKRGGDAMVAQLAGVGRDPGHGRPSAKVRG